MTGEAPRPGLPARVRRAFRGLLPGRGLVEEVDDEIAFHLAERARALEAEGWAPAPAAAEAQRRFGDARRWRDECRAEARRRDRTMRIREGLHDFGADLALAVRHLRSRPALTVPALLTLALGIGATTAIFSAVHAVVLAPLPFPEAERLVWVWERTAFAIGEDDPTGSVSAGNFTQWRRQSRSFAGLAALRYASFNLSGEGEAERVVGVRATSDFFAVFGVPPLAGRTFGAAEDVPGREGVVVLSEGLWRRRFAGDPGVVGMTVRINGSASTVIGVMPARMNAADNSEQLWMPMAFTPEREATFDEHSYQVVGRLRPGVAPASAEEELAAVAVRVRAGVSGIEAEQVRPAIVHPLLDDVVGDVRGRLLVLLGAVGLVLLIACGNVAHLLLARAAVRRRELAVRAAMGARRGRLVRQLLAESLVLGAAGGALGIAVAHGGLRLLIAAAPPGVPRLEQAAVDGAVLAFAVVLALAAGALAGLVPALSGARVDPQEALREEGAAGTGGVTRRDRLRSLLVGAEVALAVALLVGAGLLIRSGFALGRVDPGFDAAGVLTARLALPAAAYARGPATRAAFERLLGEVAAIPGVEVAALASQVPWAGGSSSNGLLPEGRPLAQESLVQSGLRLVTPDYFAALAMAPVRGRLLTAADRAGAAKVMVVNEALAAAAFPGEDPIGRRIACCEAGPDGGPSWKEVVGVVPEVRFSRLGQAEGPAFYLPLGQEPDAAWEWLQGSMALAVRAAGDPAALAPALRRAVAAVDRDLPLYDVATLAERRAGSWASERFNALLLTLLGVLGLALAAVGVYGVVADAVGQRTREIGLRLALGAPRERVARLVLGEGLAPVAAGLAAGLGLAVLGTRLLESQLYGVEGTDPLTFLAVALLLAAVAAAAGAAPLRRALAIDPAWALRWG